MSDLSTTLHRRGKLAAFVCLALASSTNARAESVAGTYEPSPQRMEVKVNTWGEDCGTRPQDQVVNEPGKVTVKEEGAHLSLKFSTRTVRSNGCWSQNPSLTLVSATSANGTYRAECRTPAGEPKRELGRYTVTASAGKLELLEESDYDWQLKSSHCVAKVRVTQTLTAVGRAKPPSEPAKVDASTPVTAIPPSPYDEEKCVPGAAARLRIRPADARIVPGERVCFVVRVVDAAGCPLTHGDAALELSLSRPAGVEGSLSGSCFKAAENAALAEGVFKLQANSGVLHAEASIVVAAPDLSDITARRVGTSSVPSASGRSAETQYETGVRAVSKGSRDTLWLGIGIAALAAVIAIAALIALRAAKKQTRAKRPRTRSSFPDRDPSASSAASKREAKGKPAESPELMVASGPQRICPKCRRGYPPGTKRCESDGEALLDYDEFRTGSSHQAAPRFCPECGQPLTSDALFCGACGHKLTMR